MRQRATAVSSWLWRRAVFANQTFAKKGFLHSLPFVSVSSAFNPFRTRASTSTTHAPLVDEWKWEDRMQQVQHGLQHLSLEQTMRDRPRISLWKRIRRILRLILLFAPLLLFTPLAYLLRRFGCIQKLWWTWLRWTLEIAGPCWVKLGQWMGTRIDLFPAQLCSELSRLHDRCRTHAFKLTERAIWEDFGVHVDQIFDLDRVPLASGAIAQVHRGRVRAGPEKGTDIALKVRHPGVVLSVWTDLTILTSLGDFVTRWVPRLAFMSIRENIHTFTRNMVCQLDLRFEARHLQQFHENFKEFENVIIPRPILPFVARSVLCETFEEGQPIQNYISEDVPKSIRKRLARVGLELYLKMLLLDHYIHADLHPGNILVRQLPNKRYAFVCLDAGLVSRLTETDALHFCELFKAVLRGDSRYATNLMINHAPEPPNLSGEDREAFVQGMCAIFERATSKPFHELQGGELLASVFTHMQRYGVKIEGRFATVMIATIVLEGVGRQLDPTINIIQTAGPFVAKHKKSLLLPSEECLRYGAEHRKGKVGS